MEKIHRDYWDKGLIVVAVSIDRGSEDKVRKKVKDYVRNMNLTFLNLLDPESSIASQYGVRGIPINFFVNPEGKVVAYASGYRKWDGKEGRKMLDHLLAGS